MAKVEVRSISKAFHSYNASIRGSRLTGSVQAVKKVNINLEEKEFVSIVGPSGCGKTTLLRIVAGLIEPDEGEVLIDEGFVRGPSPKMAMVFQNVGLLPWRTARKNIEFALEVYYHRALSGEERDEASRYLDLVGLKGFEHHYPHQLSGGMLQRVGLARALVRKPEVLLMDEPFGALDAQTRLILQDELLHIFHQYAQTVFFVTHDLDEAIYLSDRVAIMTRRPGTIKKVLRVDLSKPRYTYDVRSDPRFLELRRTAWETLKEEIGEKLQ